MQALPLEDLEKLVDNSQSINESDEDVSKGISFQEVCREYDKTFKSMSNSIFSALRRKMSKNDIRCEAQHKFSQQYLADKCPPLKLVGEGSSRVCYAFTGGKCLKIAQSLAGIAQNKQEYESTSANGAVSEFSDIFAQTYDKNSDFGMLLSECCTPIGPDDSDVCQHST